MEYFAFSWQFGPYLSQRCQIDIINVKFKKLDIIERSLTLKIFNFI